MARSASAAQRVAALVVASLLLWTSLGSAAVRTLCRMDGVVRASCCCGAAATEEGEASRRSAPHVGRASCCTVKAAPARGTPSSTPPRSLDPASLIPGAGLAPVPAAPPRRRLPAFAATERAAGLGPPPLALTGILLL